MDGNSYLYENFIYLGIKLTNYAVDKIKEIITKEENLQYIRLIYSDRKDEVLNIIISNDKVYDFYIKDITKVADSNQKIRLIMASDTDNLNNQRFIRKRSNNILCIDGVNIDKQHFLITNIYLDPIKFGNKDVNYYFQRIKLCTQESIKNICIRDDILSKITNVNNQKNINNIATNSDNAIKNSRIYVNESKENNMSTEVLKKIDEWDSYLKIIEDKARKSQLDIQYKGYKFNNNFTKCTMTFKPFTAEEIEKLQNFRNDRVILYNDNKIEGMDKRVEDVIGSIDKINTDNYSIVIALNDEIQELLSNNKMTIPKNGYLKISKMGDLAQAMNLRRGLNLLKSGKSLNKQLPMILFDIKNLDSKIEDVTIHLDKNNLLLNTLNTNQIKAVEGVLNSKDIFLIQGPPGTGKTTVIAEICYQNAIRGLKTLIASQSNLAVDNALGRIIDNPKIRALRTGNLSRVESEGEKYTEANVIKTWVDTTINTCKSNYEKKSLLLKKIDMYIRYIKNYKSNINEINLLETEMNKANTNILNLEKILNQIKVVIYEISSINLYEDTNTQLRNITIINERILTLKYLLEHKSIKIYDNDFIINNLNSLYNNNLNYYNKVKDIVILEEEIRNLKSIKKNQLKNFEQFLIYNSNNINIKYKFENYKNINKKINDIEHRIDLLRKYAHIVNNRLEELISIKIKYSISSKKVKYNTNNENNKISEDYLKKIIDNYLVDTKSIIEKRPLFMNLQRSLGLSSICKWEVNLLKYINNGYIILHLIKEKIQNYSNLISNFKSQIIYMKEECEEIIYNEIKEVERNINDARQSIEKEFKDYENSKNFIDYIIKITTSGLEENIDIISDRKQVELNKLDELTNKYNNIKRENTKLGNYLIEIIDEVKSSRLINEAKYSRLHDMTNITIDDLENLKSIINNYLKIQKEWIKEIEKINLGDKEELKKIYIEFVNVIGITCVQSGSRKFASEYNDFDVVIIDESSKATPPELLLPMLKGKKIILVGDHKQLPPVMESEVLDEMRFCDDEIDDIEYEIDEMKNSIFGKMYMNISDKNKVMLNTQYRMHSSIMNCINQFYKDNSGDKNQVGLISGVKNEEEEKNHNIDIKYIKKENHLMWIDIPLNNNYYEKRDNFSFYNETEIEVIDQILEDINNDNFENEKKQISVITFYSAQAKLLHDKFIKSKKFDSLNLRIGTVDKFQGIESEIVIVSFVRNNNMGKIGFAKDPRRINVALSRAQKLLIIVGCSELYCENNHNKEDKEAKEYYKEVIKVVNKYNGVIDAGVVFNYRSSI